MASRHTIMFRARESMVTADETTLVDATALYLITETLPTFMINMAPDGMPKYRGVEIIPFGRVAGSLGHIQVQQINVLGPQGVTSSRSADTYNFGLDVQYLIRPLITLIVTHSSTLTAVGTAGGLVGSSDVFAGTITTSGASLGSAMQSASLAGIGIYSPGAAAAVGSAIFGDLCNTQYIRLVFLPNQGGTDPTHMNALVGLWE